MQIGEISKEQVLEAAIGAKTVTEVARRLKLCDAIMSGKSGKICVFWSNPDTHSDSIRTPVLNLSGH